MKRIVMIIMAVALVALPTMAQTFGQQEPQNPVFQSTSTMQGSGSVYSPSPMLDENGTAYSPSSEEPAVKAHHPGQPRKINPIAAPTPVGDAVLPLMLMAIALAAYTAIKRRKQTENTI